MTGRERDDQRGMTRLAGLGAAPSRRAVLAAAGLSIGITMGQAAARPLAALRRGFNVPDLVPNVRRRPVDPTVLRQLRLRGMTFVRLPVRAESVMVRFAGPASIAAALDDLDRALDVLFDAGFAVMVDLHPGGALGRLYRADPAAALIAVTAGWMALASTLSRRGSGPIFAELLNEPPTSDETWRRHAELILPQVRQTLPEVPIVVGPAPFQRADAMTNWRTFSDANVVYAFHYYDPMLFTHQGARWDVGSLYAQVKNIPFPTDVQDTRIRQVIAELRQKGAAQMADTVERDLASPWTVARIARDFSNVAAWSRANDVPVVLNEFGVLRFEAAPADRSRWLAAVRSAAEASGFGWAHWDYDGGFGLVGPDGLLDQKVVTALLPGR